MNKDTMSSEKENNQKEKISTVKIDNNTYHVISKFIGTNTSSKIIYEFSKLKEFYMMKHNLIL